MTRTIELPVGGIVVTLGERDQNQRGGYLGGRVSSNLKSGPTEQSPEDSQSWNAAIDVLETLILAHACAGMDITSPAYLEGIETALDAISNNL